VTYLSVVVLAVGLAMDATAVAAARGLAAPGPLRARHYVMVAVYFGGFQAAMPLLGWLLGRWIGPAIEAWDHWIAFVLLGGIGAKMIHAAWRGGDADATPADRMFAPAVMVVLALATSIDAAAAGITLPMFAVPIGVSVALIGVITAVLSAIGLAVGRRAGARLGRRLDVAGGVVLIALGTKILIQHLAA
jgi:putative Mn2+ efflux pump MntP